MYLMDEMVIHFTDPSLVKDWSEDRRTVFLNLTVGVPGVDMPEHLNELARRVSKIQESELREITPEGFESIV